MASVTKSSIEDEAAAIKKEDKESMAADVQSYLISNYRDALRRGDKGAAKACLLAARCFTENDPNVANEIYTMAKADGDIEEASKSFESIFNNLFASTKVSEISKACSNEEESIKNRMKDELKTLFDELESLHLQSKTSTASTDKHDRQKLAANVVSDKHGIKELALKSNNHPLIRSFSYKALFEHLPDTTKRALFDYVIECCDDPIEKCKLIMLDISVFNDNVASRASHLLKLLIDLSCHNKKHDEQPHKLTPSETTSQPTRQHAKSLLVLDAIPLVVSKVNLSSLDIEFGELYEMILSFSSEQWLEKAAKESKPSELDEEVRKSIAKRILDLEHTTPSDITEGYSQITIDLLVKKFLETVENDQIKTLLVELNSIVGSKSQLEQITRIIENLNLPDDATESAEDKLLKEKPSKPVSTTSPAKGRGRPKKIQQSKNANLDEAIEKNKSVQLGQKKMVFFSLVQHMFLNLSIYLRNTRSRIIVNFDNPLIDLVEIEPAKSSSQQRTSRSKAGSQQQASDSVAQPLKKLRLEKFVRELSSNSNQKASPLTSDQSKQMDKEIIAYLKEAYDSYTLLSKKFDKYWTEFVDNNDCSKLLSFRRLLADGNLLSQKYDIVVDTKHSTLEQDQKIPIVPPDAVEHLRTLAQQISCYVLIGDRINALNKISDLFGCMTQWGIFASNENYSNGNSIGEYKINVKHNDQVNLGFLFFDSVSLTRYCIDILMSILKKHLAAGNSVSDTLIGHIIVLSQFDWPKEYQIYQQCIDWIRDQKPKSTTPQCLSAATKFTYPEFFLYMRNPTIIEDFMAMLCQGYTLDIKSAASSAVNSQARNGNGSNSSSSTSRTATSGSSSRSNKAITTRGVNKTFKEDLKVAFVAQMKMSSSIVPIDVISEFIQASLVPYLSSIKK